MLVSSSNVQHFDVPDRPDAGALTVGNGHEGLKIDIAGRLAPIQFDMATASVIGEDQRRRIYDTTELPWRLICKLEIETARGKHHGTGWLAGPRTIITCGHCLYSPEDFGGWARRIVAAPGLSGAQQPFAPVSSETFACADDWRVAQDRANDIGCIHLDTPIGNTLGWFKFAPASEANVIGDAAVVTGYPYYLSAYFRLMTGKGNVEKFSARRMFHDVDTDEGQSGAPMWHAEDFSPTPTVFGVHAYPKGPPEPTLNSAVLITHNIHNLILRWSGVGL